MGAHKNVHLGEYVYGDSVVTLTTSKHPQNAHEEVAAPDCATIGCDSRSSSGRGAAPANCRQRAAIKSGGSAKAPTPAAIRYSSRLPGWVSAATATFAFLSRP
jgi:hypothetical protein